MSIKSFFLSLILVLSFSCFASTAVGDYLSVVEYNHLEIDEVYVVNAKGCIVKESPDEFSRTLITLPAGINVRIMSVNGPVHSIKGYGDRYYDEHWTAIYLPENLRKNGNQIGWIQSPDETWWSAPDFTTEGWEEKQLRAYLQTSMWEYIYYKNGFELDNGICAFDKGVMTGVSKYDKPISGSFTEESGSSIEFKSNTISDTTDLVKLNIGKYSFSYNDGEKSVSFRKIHPGYKYRRKDIKDTPMLYKFLIDESKKNFRMMTEDYYTGQTCAQFEADRINDGGKVEDNLLSYSIGNGAYINDSLSKDFWIPIIKKCEAAVKDGTYIYKGIEHKCEYLVKGISYITNERLRLRKSEKTSSEIITTMPVGTNVKILKFGEVEAIDGVISNWVEVQLDDGKTGWCFGGYLSYNG